MDAINTRDGRRVGLPHGNGDGVEQSAREASVGELFRRFTSDASHMLQQELQLARLELRDTGAHLGSSAAKLGVALGVALPGVLALTAFAVIGLGDLLDNYWLSALIVGVVLLAVGATLARSAIAHLREGFGAPVTAATLREDARWAKTEAAAFKREFTS